MTPADDDCAAGALSYDDGAAFLGVSKRLLEELVRAGELEAVYEGRKPRVLKGQLIARLARQLEAARAQRATSAGARTR
jgi:excisionase family DNA binding protein